MAYAESTTVTFEKSIAEIVALLKKAGAARIMQIDDPDGYMVQFFMCDRMLRFKVRFPTLEETAQRCGPRQDVARVADQWRRQRGRALLLVIKAKLESVESGVETFEEAFLAHVVMGDGATVYDRIAAPIAVEYETGAPSVLLLGGPS